MNKHKWILLAEDNENDADLALRALSLNQAPQDVVVARDGAETLDCLYQREGFHQRGTGNPTVVLLDLKMPRVDGLEVLRQVKADPRLRTIPIVMLTSSREEADLARSYHLGVNAYVVKPMDFQQFVVALKEIRMFWAVINEPPPDGVAGLAPPQSQVVDAA
jgi:CheY-like chemotaxis protein